MNAKTKAEVVDMLEETLNACADLMEMLEPRDFSRQEDYWLASKAVAVAGGIVVREAKEMDR